MRMPSSSLLVVTSSLFVLFACDNKDKGSTTSPITASTDTPALSASAITSAVGTTTINPVPTPTDSVATTPTPTPTPTTTTTTTTTTTSVAKTPPTKASGTATPAALKPASKHVSGKNYALDLASPGCKASEECAMTIKISVAGEYHVNKEYPYKFVATPQPNVAFLGKSDANTFARSSGDFVEQGEKTGLMTVRFKPSSAGEAKVAGTYKMSVCSAEQCQIEQETVELAVPVM